MITTFGWGGPPVLVLDENPGACAAYSLRRLSGLYNGPAIRVRRSSDNAEQDIYFTDSFNFDIAAFNTFVGASTAYVRTWYDQSGNGKNVSQTTAAKQPVCNGTALSFFDTGSHAYTGLVCNSFSNGFQYTGGGSIYAVAKANDNNSGGGNIWDVIISQGDGTNYMLNLAFTKPFNGSWLKGQFFSALSVTTDGNSNKSVNTYYLVNIQWSNFSTVQTDSSFKMRFNGAENNPYTITGSNPTSLAGNVLSIGSTSNTSFYGLSGAIKEILLYPSINSNVLDSNINNFYSVY